MDKKVANGTECCYQSKDDLKKDLTPLQYKVTQEKGTERAFTGKFNKFKGCGVYCCIVCKEHLFASETKYDSGSGWPAFYDIIDSKRVTLKKDLSHVGANIILLALKPGLVRTEVSCSKCSAHLGHLFDDGPKPSGKRFCVNSASLDFIGNDEMEVDRSAVPEQKKCETQWISCQASERSKENSCKRVPHETSL